MLDSGLNLIADTTVGSSVTVSSGVAAPEINVASAASALALLLGGIAVMRGRRTTKLDSTGA